MYKMPGIWEEEKVVSNQWVCIKCSAVWDEGQDHDCGGEAREKESLEMAMAIHQMENKARQEGWQAALRMMQSQCHVIAKEANTYLAQFPNTMADQRERASGRLAAATSLLEFMHGKVLPPGVEVINVK